LHGESNLTIVREGLAPSRKETDHQLGAHDDSHHRKQSLDDSRRRKQLFVGSEKDQSRKGIDRVLRR
jgi:hypothetical protein